MMWPFKKKQAIAPYQACLEVFRIISLSFHKDQSRGSNFERFSDFITKRIQPEFFTSDRQALKPLIRACCSAFLEAEKLFKG